ncbi:hypothetical protein [Mesorhizobium sp. M4B.F.Ca.ET.089.01.1.1]|uniref:hypothetical protein n=1 Tax=Mesorhizobium sp. M4B.F.Ca.ET.089.01.1.1 TaxID=2496662 RepID=UPI00167926E5|nr:hypothetical protein [Mesorhizobium sp. M4B.F.Ca.ET.089.01.1.1]
MAAYLDACLVHVPLAGDGALAPVEALQKLGREVNDPAVHGRMVDVQAAFGHHLVQIAQARSK